MNEWITRNLLLTGVSDEYLKKAADFISNKIMVEKGKINITQHKFYSILVLFTFLELVCSKTILFVLKFKSEQARPSMNNEPVLVSNYFLILDRSLN